jgi:hypothetical protein
MDSSRSPTERSARKDAVSEGGAVPEMANREVEPAPPLA